MVIILILLLLFPTAAAWADPWQDYRRDPFISRVEYYLNGELVGTPASPPYQLSIDFNRLPGEGSLVVKAYDS
ncbi:hypothetical protein MHOCP_20620 [Moorella humiferrea]|uniref:Ig-like domain-containing protein n=1 Tax=Neomoorella humiferrea TaxID=676965 RepID=UPI0030CE9102